MIAFVSVKSKELLANGIKDKKKMTTVNGREDRSKLIPKRKTTNV